MKISNRNLIIILGLVVIILLGWSWFSQKGFLNKNSGTANSVSEERENKNESTNKSLEDFPSLRIVFPGNQAIISPGSITVTYSLSGKIDEVERVHFILFNKGETVIQQPGFFSRISKTGNQIFPNLEEGEYQLLARLVNKDGNYVNGPFSETTVTFIVRENITGQ